MKLSVLVASALCSLCLSSAALAHHSFAAQFDANKPIRLVGTITKIQWSNPHSYFFIDVIDKSGKTSTWACEGAGPGALSRRGWNKGDLKFGDALIVDGYLAKDGSRLIDARRVKMPDGRILYGGTSGDGGPGQGQPSDG